MNEVTKNRLEALRPQVPRYLFRAWNNTAGGAHRISGGTMGLNTADAITPLAFLKFQAPKSVSVYGMTREIFASLAAAHVMGRAMVTPFSSWTASLQFALSFARANLAGSADANHIHISVIDTKKLWDSNPVFWVPSLSFLPAQIPPFNEEYLAFGVVQGRWHKAVPLQAFSEMGALVQWPGDLTPDAMKRVATLAHAYGPDFALPVYLAVLCETGVQNVEGNVNLKLILGGRPRVKIPQEWAKDTEVIACDAFPGVVKFNDLMQVLVQKSKADNLFEQDDSSDEADDPPREGVLLTKKRARIDDDETEGKAAKTNKKRVRIDANTDDTTSTKKRPFDDDDDFDMGMDTSESEVEPTTKKAKHTITTTAAAPKELKPILKKPATVYASAGVTTRRMSKAGRSIFKGPGITTRRASVAMDGELKKLVIDMKD